MRKALGGLALLAALILGYGYWHVSSYGWLDIWLNDVSQTNTTGRVLNAELVFLDGTGTTLAWGRTDETLGIVFIYHPQVGDCSREYREYRETPSSREAWKAWDQCKNTQSRWLMTWARELRYLDLNVGDCRLKRVPVSVEEDRDMWWLWWVPLPHIGGVRDTAFTFTLRFDSVACRAIQRPRGPSI